MLPPKVVSCAALLTPGVGCPRRARRSKRQQSKRLALSSAPELPAAAEDAVRYGWARGPTSCGRLAAQLRGGAAVRRSPSWTSEPAQSDISTCQTVVASGFGGAWRGELAPLALRHCTPHFSARGLCIRTLDGSRPTPCPIDLPRCGAVGCDPLHARVFCHAAE